MPRVRTPLVGDAVRWAMSAGHYEATGGSPSYDRLASACAMVGVEHAARLVPGGPVLWGGAVWCFNLGNIGVAHGPKAWIGDFFRLSAVEVLDGKRVLINQPLRAHSCATAGAADYWAFLLQARFAEVIAAFDAGDVESAAHELWDQHYYTAKAEDYARGMLAWSRTYARTWPR